ncbi:resolvase-like protein [Azospirillum baldaniorum]|uniref:recombinase family protein n=1 Tax=Azospirillum baldaniorum TaxID=1064539 RepID=UPI0011A7AFAA|nr:recombinase family protein [Azospirillum baldaniorum]TWA71894.1 resolvase-like protein [Azospirillum baldaniorum]
MKKKSGNEQWDWGCVKSPEMPKRKWKRRLTKEQIERKKRTAVAYIRTGADYEKDIGTQGQIGAIREFCTEKGFDLVAVVEDMDCPGTTPPESRDGYRSALAALEREAAGALVLWRPDRLSNDMEQAGGAAGYLRQKLDVACYSASCGAHTNGPQALLLFTLFAAFEPRNPNWNPWE